MSIRSTALAIGLSCIMGASALAQGTEVAFGGLQHDSTLPVEIVSDQLQISQNDGTAIFIGNVVIGQGEMRISAAKVTAFYASEEGESTGQISRILATGGVTVVNGSEAAEAEEADYSVSTGTILMTGDVILTQGQNAIASESMVINLDTGTAQLDGRVRTIIQPAGGN